MNVGAEYRKDELDYQPDTTFASGDIAGGNPGVFPVSGMTNVKELFAEARVPLVEDRQISSLVAEAGYRQSWQSNPENRFAMNSYKIGLEFAPLRDVRFRATLQRAVRAPNVQVLFSPIFRHGFHNDPCAGVVPEATIEQCARTGVTAAQYGRIAASPNPDVIPYNAISGGNPALDPEKATTKSVGVVLRPSFIPGLNATVDWFDISLRGAIELIGPTIIMDTCLGTGDSLHCSRIHRDANGSLWQTLDGFVDNRAANIGSIKLRGVDVGLTYGRSFGRRGSLDFELLGQLDRPSDIYRRRSCSNHHLRGCLWLPLRRAQSRMEAQGSCDLGVQRTIFAVTPMASCRKRASGSVHTRQSEHRWPVAARRRKTGRPELLRSDRLGPCHQSL